MSDEARKADVCTAGPTCVGSEALGVIHRGKKYLVPIPYAITLGGVNIAGILYLADPIEDSYTDGAFIGVVIGTYHLAKDHLEACADNGLLRVCVKIDLENRILYGRYCTRKINGGWDCRDWEEILRW
jgi:hypothetical protein